MPLTLRTTGVCASNKISIITFFVMHYSFQLLFNYIHRVVLMMKYCVLWFLYIQAYLLITLYFWSAASCEKCYKQIEAAIAKYREIKENINEGLKFYVTLQVINFFVGCNL